LLRGFSHTTPRLGSAQCSTPSRSSFLNPPVARPTT
jgi:hypothetical protein